MIYKFDSADLLGDLPDANPVAHPLGDPISMVQSRSSPIGGDGRDRAGVWKCSPGIWRRQVTQAEFCTFIDGECSFTPDNEETIEIRPGDVLFFPANSGGIWNVRVATTKIFLIFDQAQR